MKTKFARCIMFAAVVVASISLTAAPQVQDVTFRQDNLSSRKVTITYRLTTEPAIVTIDIQTNGMSIGEANLTHFAGDVNRVVQVGEHRTAYWYPDKAWPGHRSDAARAVVTAWATNAPPNYMVVDLNDGATTYYTSTNCLPDGGLSNDIYRTTRMVFRKIPARGVTWRMGSPVDELGREEDETPHLVTLTKDYWFGIYPVTMGQHKVFMGDNSEVAPTFCYFTNIASHLTRPMQGIGMKSVRSWTANYWPDAGHAVDAGTYLSAFRAKVGGRLFDLPTEAQWEYAARAGVGTALTTGNNLRYKTTDTQLDSLGRYDKNCGASDNASESASIRAIDDSAGTSKVGIFQPNRWGVYDIHGNVSDLCLDRYTAYVGDMESVQTNPRGGNSSCTECVARGGGWGYVDNNGAAHCRLAARRRVLNSSSLVISFRHIGYRLCLEIE